MRSEAVTINPEVRRALDASTPVVALESTIIAHGMPYPTNFDTALAVEQIVREAGAIPATIGIIEGDAVPLPVTPRVCGLFVASSTIWSVAVSAPEESGVNVTVIVHDPPAGTSFPVCIL